MNKNRTWDIFLIQHSHIDVGFTHRQELIEKFRRDFLSQAISMAASPKQDSRGDLNKFKFTCEGFWAVEKFLERAGSEEKKQLIAGFKKGFLELSPLYLHLTELPDEITFKTSFDPALEFAAKHGINIDTAMSNDVNGFTWGMSQIMYDAGIRYLSTSINPHHGGFPFNTPLKPFYWETPGGDRILSWAGLPYHKGNLLGLIPALTPDDNPGIPGVQLESSGKYIDIKENDISLAEKKIFPMLKGLEQSGYNYSFLPVMAGGLYTDNNPPIAAVCELIAHWNKTHGNKVRIRTATVKEFLQHVEENAGDLETFKGDWTDWWADGVSSTPAETALFRNAQRTRNLLMMLDPEGNIISDKRRKKINNLLVMYSEHTWGHTNTNSPWSQIVQQSLLRKGKFAVEADEQACRALDDVKTALGEGSFTSHRPFRYRVVNPLGSDKKGYASLPYDAWEVFKIQGGIRVLDKDGRVYPFQIERKLREYFIVVPLELGAEETRDLFLEFIDEPLSDFPIELFDNYFEGKYISQLYSEESGYYSGIREIKDNSFENDWFSCRWSQKKGIFSLIDKLRGKELISEDSPGFLTPLYQRFFAADRVDPAGFNLSPRKIPKGTITAGILEEVIQTVKGACYSRLLARYRVDGAEYLAVDITFHNLQPKIDMTVRMTKDNVADPEGMYIAFPLALEQGEWTLDKTGKAVVPGKDQLPAACSDYFLIQDGAVLTNDEMGIALSIKDAPLVHIGKMRLWDYSTGIEPVGPLFSWLTNNKWDVNFKGACGGFYEFNYTMETGRGFKEKESALSSCKNNLYDFITLRTD